METALYIKELYKKSYTEETPVEVFTHNQSLLEALKSSKLWVKNGYELILQY